MNRRIDYLDSIRGLAAFSVVIYHALHGHWAYLKSVKTASILINGSDAVSLFFVLSGIVLSLKYLPANKEEVPLQYPKYVVARILRIYPPLMVIVLIHYIYQYGAGSGVDFWLFDTLIHNNNRLWENMLLMRGIHDLYTPSWSLGVEMAFSLLLPFLIILIRKDRRYFIYLLIAGFFVGKNYLSIFILHFGLGILIAYYFEDIRKLNLTQYKAYKYRWLIGLLVLAMYSLRHIDKLSPFGSTIRYFMENILYLDFFHFSGVASAVMLAYTIHSTGLQQKLQVKPLLFLGKISYSLYLTHWLVIQVFMDNYTQLFAPLNNEVNELFVFLAVTTILSLVFATIFYYLIEKPVISFGKKVLKKYAHVFPVD